ncbi:hypothetical protein KVV02_003330, partial [Mortierella alpina]
MKWPKLPAAKVLAIGACIGLVHRAETTPQHQQHTWEMKAEDGQHICTQFNLVCDSNVVDTINCLEHSSNIWSNKHCKVKQTFFIDMAEPCFEFPAQRASTESTDESMRTLDGAEDGVGPAADLEESEEDDDEHDADVVAEKQVLLKRWDERRHRKHRQSRRHPFHIKPKHLWSGLCVSTGVFCGNDLFGCDFNSKGLYKGLSDLLDLLDPLEPTELLDPKELLEPTELLGPTELLEPTGLLDPKELLGPTELLDPKELLEPTEL